jgi:hypothetical protein
MGRGIPVALGLEFLGHLALQIGDAARAESLFTEALQMARADGESSATGRFLRSLGDGLRANGELHRSAERYRESLLLAKESGDSKMVAEAIVGLAGLATDTGRYREAARLFGMVESQQGERKPAGLAYTKARLDHDQADVRAALGPPAADSERAAGRTLGLQTGIEPALMLADEIAILGRQAGKPSAGSAT